jgi:Flp pilus assembly protein TadD/tRNA A-37 threonylcarbamoyl transferase component Bud32
MGARPQTIGPYTLGERLGAGGMGEVYQAYDERLDRWVAVKLIRSDHLGKPTVRERFRREARAAARLSHPSIVQIHDVVESDESDAIIMELVEGEPLACRIARGPLPVPEAVRLGKEIAEGLAAAHAKGLIHRDLKPENVMITAEGRAKILDFGLAKRLEGEASLTADHRVLGTFRSMSPEQARGMPLDARSDLFSFGLLVYEMLSGVSPFEGISTLETLTQICTRRQAPLRQVRPEIPEKLSNLVDRLLEKDPSLRPSGAREVAGTLAGWGEMSSPASLKEPETLVDGSAVVPRTEAMERRQGASGLSYAVRWPRRRWALAAGLLAAAGLILGVLYDRFHDSRSRNLLYVAVPRTTLLRESAGADLLAASLRSSLLAGLLAVDGVRPLAPDQVDPIAGSPRDLARATAADEVVTSDLSCDVASCVVSLSRLRGTDGTLIWTRSFTVPIEQPYLGAEAVHGYLRQAYPARSSRSNSGRLEVRPQDYATYLKLFESFDKHREKEYSIDQILERLAAVRRGSPKFLEAFIFEAYMLQHRFRSGRDPRDLERAYGVLEEARKLDPDDPRVLSSTFEVAFLGEDLARAAAALHALELLQPGDVLVQAQRARLLDRQGDSQKALVLMRQAVERLPSWKNLFWLADMEYRQGKIPEARGHLQLLLRRSPGNLTGSSLLAQLELFNGEPRKAAALYGDLVRLSPKFAYLANLGLADLLLGDLDHAEQNFRRAWEQQPRNAFIVLNLADACYLLGHKPEAEAFYRRTLELADQDPTARSNWQIFSTRAQALAHLGKSGQAVAAIQEAMRLAPANPQVAYEASLVYVLLGDHASASFNAERALKNGIEPRWFTLPWFDPLRGSPVLQHVQSGT